MSEWFTEPHVSRYQGGSSENIEIQFPWLANFAPRKRFFNGRSYELLKRFMDLSIIFFSLPGWVFVLGLCALLIKIEERAGKVIFYQERTGKGGRRFKMYKFRTMVMNAEELKSELAHLNELQWPDFKITNDPRITKIGRFLRKTSLDELPQIWNVIHGEMSIVGPRPTSFSAETYALWQTERLDVLPGITGLWQLLGRGETEFDERLRMDIAYIERRSLWLDTHILLRTVFAVLGQRGAK